MALRETTHTADSNLFAKNSATSLTCAIHQRQFPNWSMQFVPAVDVTKDVLRRHGVTSKFEPYNLTTEGAVSLMVELLERQKPAN